MWTEPTSPTEALFHGAIAHTPAERAAYLDAACNGNAELRREIERLVAAHLNDNHFVDGQVFQRHNDENKDAGSDRRIGEVVGRYRLVERVASGGMGTVFRAVRADGQFEQDVAVKIISRPVPTTGVRARFQLERQTLARLEHPYITRLIDGGTTDDGMPYLVMELVQGRPLDRFCDETRCTLRQRLALFVQVCEAVQYAHQHLVVHRDLKPGNVLVTRDGVPKLLDFGIAKLLGDDLTSLRTDATAGTLRPFTPQYASPEQIRGEPIATTSDVYSLGVILYELLTGRRPYSLDGMSPGDRERIICEEVPPSPSSAVARSDPANRSGADSKPPTSEQLAQMRGENPNQLRRRLRGDLNNIVLMALRKDPLHRYSSVEQMAADVRRYLDGCPVAARKSSWTYRASKFCGRNRAATAASAALVLTLLVGIVSTMAALVRAQRAERDAVAERNMAVRAESEAQTVTAFLRDVLAAANPYRNGRDATVLELLAAAEERIPRELADQPAVEAGVRYAIAHTYAGMWQWPAAVPHLRISLKLTRERYGDEDARVADCLNLLGRALTFALAPESARCQREGLAIRRKLHGPEHSQVAESLGNLGFALWHGVSPPRWNEAERHYREALAMYHRLGDEPVHDVARFTFSLAMMLSASGRFAEAEPLFQEALVLFERPRVGQDRYHVESLRGYAHLLRAVGRDEEARVYLRRAEDLTPNGLRPKRALADETPTTVARQAEQPESSSP